MAEMDALRSNAGYILTIASVAISISTETNRGRCRQNPRSQASRNKVVRALIGIARKGRKCKLCLATVVLHG